jgi:hypothetical protein
MSLLSFNCFALLFTICIFEGLVIAKVCLLSERAMVALRLFFWNPVAYFLIVYTA